MGDLNENHDEFHRLQGAALSALLPDDPEAAALAAALTAFPGEEFLLLSGEKPPRARYFDPSTPALYSPWGNELEGGSYYYRNAWETIDHFLLSEACFDGQGWEFADCRVLNSPPFTKEEGQSGAGQPYAYRVSNGLGLSDHLPLLLLLKK